MALAQATEDLVMDDLDTLSDEALNEAFAIEVAGYKRLRYCTPGVAYLIPPIVASYFAERGDESWKEAEASDKTVWFAHIFREYAHFKEPRFTVDANLVLPWLAKHTATLHFGDNHAEVECEGFGSGWFEAIVETKETPTMADGLKAAVIALIRAKRAMKP